MILIGTIHWKTDKWIRIQQKYLQKNAGDEYRTYALLSPGLDPAGFEISRITEEKDHGKNLNHLLEIILDSWAGDEEFLVLLDGDAFPVLPLVPYLLEKLSDHPLIALERLENSGEYIPHPAFCVARVGWWRSTGFKWGKGTLIGEFGNDPGAGLFEELEKAGVPWGRIHRSNKRDLHPLYFGLYDDTIYHHGAGFREPISRIDMEIAGLKAKQANLISRVLEGLPDTVFRGFKRKFSPYRREEYNLMMKNGLLQREVFDQICNDDRFYSRFI